MCFAIYARLLRRLDAQVAAGCIHHLAMKLGRGVGPLRLVDGLSSQGTPYAAALPEPTSDVTLTVAEAANSPGLPLQYDTGIYVSISITAAGVTSRPASWCRSGVPCR